MHSEAMDNPESVGKRIRMFRKGHGMTQQELGLAIGAGTPASAKTMIAKIEAGQVPGGMRIRKIADALDCSTDILLSGRSSDLFEVVRFLVLPTDKLDAVRGKVFRAARILLFCAVGRTPRDEKLLATANRLFHASFYDRALCKKLNEHIGEEDEHESDLLQAVQEAFGTQQPEGYAEFRFAWEAADRVLAHYDRPTAPPEARPVNTAADATPMRIPDDSLVPLARKGQTMLLANAARKPVPGDLVACQIEGRTTPLCGRLIAETPAPVLAPVNPGENLPPYDTITEMRVIVGVLFG